MLIGDAQLIMLQNTTKQARQFIKPEDIGSLVPAQERQPGPISQELQELHDVIEQLEKQYFTLSDRLRTVYPMDTSPLNKSADGIAVEPATGCELKDHIAHVKQQALYIKRLYNELAEKLWI